MKGLLVLCLFMKDRNIISLPIICVVLYIALYIYSAYLYPGGSPVNTRSEGFDWINNYWCNLTDQTALNGMDNLARPFAIAAMITLCVGLGIFFFLFSESYPKSIYWKNIIKYSGIIAMTCTTLIFTNLHNIMIGIASIFGLFALIGVFIALIQNKRLLFLSIGMLCMLLLAANNYIYYSGTFLSILPLLQKISTATFLLWVVLINISLRNVKIER